MNTGGPLDGRRVLEFGGYLAAPYATALLAALGADVIKVERPTAGDDFRRGAENTSPFFRQFNAGKRSIAVDLRHPEGAAAMRRLIPGTDVLLENLRPGKLASIGLGPEDCRSLHPDLVYASTTAFGSGGSLAGRPAYDTIAQGFTGLYSVLSDDEHPRISGTCVADLVTGLSNAAGILAALAGRLTTGRATRVESSLLEATSVLTMDALTQWFAEGRVPARDTRNSRPREFLLSTSTRPLALHLEHDRHWKGLVEAVEDAWWAEDPRFTSQLDRERHHDELESALQATFAADSHEAWERRLAARDVPCSAVLSLAEQVDHPQLDELGLLGPERDGLRLVGAPWRFDGIRPRRGDHTPRVGEHTREILGEVYAPEAVEELIARGVVHAGG